MALHERLSVQHTSMRFVRIRADLSMPSVDQATVLRNLSAMRPWMLEHERVCTGVWLDEMSRAFAAEPHSWPWDNASAPVNLNFVRQARPGAAAQSASRLPQRVSRRAGARLVRASTL